MDNNIEILTDLISQKRLNKYNTSINKAIEQHFFNTEICESFYSSLSYLEIVLRNKIDLVFSKYLGVDWLSPTSEIYLLDKNSEAMKKTASNLATSNFEQTDKNKLISDLSFGFWTFLFNDIYKKIIWDKYPNILYEIFSGNKEKLKLEVYANRLNNIRNYRNKVFHYGAITKYKYPVQKMHNIILAMLKDLGAKPILNKLSAIDNFNSAYKKGKSKNFI